MNSLAIGPIMIDVEGHSLSALDKEKIAHPNTGGLILFARNYENPQQVKALISDIRAARNGEILIAVDQEGGRVQRFQNGFTRLPAAAVYQQHPDLAEDAGWLMAAELLAVGVDFSFAPVLDVDCGISQVIGDRSFSRQSEQAAELSSRFRIGMKAAGMAATGKHFPGHGSVALDSHLTLPEDPRDLAAIRQHDLVPFKRLIDEGLEAIMPAHVVYPLLDKMPAGFSRFWLQEILRGELGFDGAIFSDDLSMEGAAIAGDFCDRARLADEAGCDMILVCNNPAAAEQVLDGVRFAPNAARQRHLNAMIGRPQFELAQLATLSRWQSVSKQLSQLTA